MSVTKIAARYAKSLIDLAHERGNLPTVLEDMTSFDEITDNRDFYLLLKSPIVSREKKLDVFKVLFDGKVDELTQAFLTILVKKGRENYLPEIADEFLHQYKVMNHISEVKLTTATQMPDAQLEKIKATLLASNATDQKVEITTAVDESLIGGFIVEIGDKLYDASVAHKIAELKKSFSGNDYEKAF